MQIIQHRVMYRVARDFKSERQQFKVMVYNPLAGDKGIVGFFTSEPPNEFIAKRSSCERIIKTMQDAGHVEFAHAFVEQAYFGPDGQKPNVSCPQCKRFVWIPEILMSWTCLHCGHVMMLMRGKE